MGRSGPDTQDQLKKLAQLERKRQLQKEYRLANPEKARADNRRRNKAWAERNPEWVKELNRRKAIRHYYRNVDAIREKMRQRASKQYQSLSKNGRSARHMKAKYSMTLEEFEAMRVVQNGLCAACGGEPTTWQGLMVDHCHRQGHVRALLCHHCNAGLGHAKDDPAILRKWIAYLER
jgi:1,4-alpha-glucan branching enzyme